MKYWVVFYVAGIMRGIAPEPLDTLKRCEYWRDDARRYYTFMRDVALAQHAKDPTVKVVDYSQVECEAHIHEPRKAPAH